MASVMLRETPSSSTRPCLRRSSGTRAMPRAVALRGLPFGSGIPSRRTLPLSYGSTPKIARATSLRPAPTRPASPTISPARTVKVMSRNTPARVSPSTSSTTSPTSAGSFGNSSVTSRPTIWRTSSSTVVSAIGVVSMYEPSRITVTVSQRANTSSKRCEMNSSARPSSRRLRATAKSRSTSTPESAAVGSSMMSTRASSEMALAISMICWSAIERPSVTRSGSSATPRRSKISTASARIALRSIRPDAVGRLAAHEDVLGHRQIGEERRLLVDDRDARGLRLRGAGEVDRLAVEQEVARIAAVEAGDDLDERRLARAVLADQGVDRAAVEREAARAQRDHGPEGLHHPVEARARAAGACCVWSVDTDPPR